MEELFNRRVQTISRIQELKDKLKTADDLASDKACVYVTGSFGRKEAGPHSDLDLFIVGKSDDKGRSLLGGLDEIYIKAELIKATRALGIQDFSGDGLYLTHYSVSKLANSVGKQEDDVENTLTARLLLLLESSSLLGDAVYEDVIKSVIKAYW